MSLLNLVYTAIPAGFTLVLPIQGGTISNVSWGDAGFGTTLTSHVYANEGNYTVEITGSDLVLNYSSGTPSGQ